MLQIQNLTLTLKKNLRVLIDDFTFVLNPGDRAVLIGEEGNGKSTLLRCIHDPASVSDYADVRGKILYGGARCAYLEQELPAADTALSPYELFSARGLFDRVAHAELCAVCSDLGTDPELLYAERPFSSFSGGEKVRLRIAALLAERPDILLLDEPSNDIDLSTLAWLEQFLLGCGLSVLYVSHDETLIERTANVVIHLEQIRKKTTPRHTIARVPYAQYVSGRERAIEHDDRVARKQRADFERQQQKLRQLHDRVEHELDTITRADPGGGRLLKKKMKAVTSQSKRFEREKESFIPLPEYEEAVFLRFEETTRLPPGKTVLELELPELTAGGKTLCRDISLRVCGPQRVVIVGPNGAGKTTLLREIAANLLQRTDLRAGYMPQDYADLLRPEDTPLDFLAPGGDLPSVTRARTYMGSMKFTRDEMTGSIAELSGGQKAKLLLLSMVLRGCDVLILDEPTRNFSPLSGPVVRGLLRDFGGAVIASSHDRKFIAEVCTRVLRLTPEGLVQQM